MSDVQPFPQLPPVEPELFERAREAVQAIRGRGRAANGQGTEGNTLTMTHGLYSQQLMHHVDMVAWHSQQVEVITTDLGGEQELSALARAAVREVARVEVIMAALGGQLLERGVLTPKGRQRAALSAYHKTLDRFIVLTKTLGLERRARAVPQSPTQALMQAPEAR